jgi:hypothetical protein
MEAWGLKTILVCFGGGIMGAAMGPLFSFVICGLVVLSGCMFVLGGGSDFILMQIGLGPVFGPHIGFGAALVAATYADGVKNNHPGGSAKDILSPLMDSSWDVLVIGGVAAVCSHVLLQLLAVTPFIKMFDCIALTVVLVPMLARLLFQKQMPWGCSESGKKHGLLGTNNYAISWAPWNAPPARLAVLGLGAGIFSGAIAMGTKTILDPMAAAGTVSATGAFVVPLIMAWAIAAITLIGINLGSGSIQKFPIWHCQAILAALAFLLFNSLVIAAIVGVLAAFLQELMARMFYNHGANHIDPPAAAIALGTLVLNLTNNFLG